MAHGFGCSFVSLLRRNGSGGLRPTAMLHRKRHTTYARTAKRDNGMLSHLNHVPSEKYDLSKYRVAHLVQEKK